MDNIQFTAIFLVLAAIYFRVSAIYRQNKDGFGEGLTGVSILLFALAGGAFTCGVFQWITP